MPRRIFLIALLLFVFVAGAAGATKTLARKSAECGPGFDVIPTEPSQRGGVLNSVAFLPGGKALAVGYSFTGFKNSDGTDMLASLIEEEGDGEKFSVIPSPRLNSKGDWLNAVAVGGNVAVAVGSYYYPLPVKMPAKRSPSPNKTPIVANLILRRVGGKWQQVARTPNLGRVNTLLGVWGSSDGKHWVAVGFYKKSSKLFGDRAPVWASFLVSSDFGRSWTAANLPLPFKEGHWLSAVAGMAFDDLWLTGTNAGRTLILHWDGEKAGIVPSLLDPGRGGNVLTDIVAISKENIWFLGYFYPTPGEKSFAEPLVLRWDGESFQAATPEWGAMQAITAFTSGEIWGLGGDAIWKWRNPAPEVLSSGSWQLQQLSRAITRNVGYTFRDIAAQGSRLLVAGAALDLSRRPLRPQPVVLQACPPVAAGSSANG